ncbi:PAS domain-containing protein [Streptomyces sp. NPDC059590]|uniref:response regulator n=1 Tax=Streptomyces sp. NPDC059590 TaxID=3346877 RepID=UPI00368BFBCB
MSSRPSRGAARLAAILDALPDALLLVNCNGTVVNANHIALETFEVPGTALVGRGLLDLLPSFDSNRIPGSMRRPDDQDEAGRTKPTRMMARRTDGMQFPVEVTSANLEDGRTPYADQYSYTGDELLMLVVRDLTGTLDTEAELARQQRQTEMILRAAAEGVVGVDTEGKVVLVNPSAAQILGYRASDLGGQELHPLVHHSRPDGSPLPYEESPLIETLRSGRKYRVRGQTLWAKDGSAVPVDLTTAPVRDGEQLVGAVMTFTDRRPEETLVAKHAEELESLTAEHAEELKKLTARHTEEREKLTKQLAEQRKELTAQLAREREGHAERYDALAARNTQLLAVLDQSLRGPLLELRGELAVLADDPAGQLWPEANQILHHLAAGYTRMTTLVDNVLSYQRLDSGGEDFTRHAVSMDEVVSAGVEGAVELIGPGRAQFAVHAPPIEAEVDAERLAQALAHLIADVAGVDSTGKATGGPGGATGDSTIVVAAAQRGDVVRIEVRGPYAGGDPVHEPIVRGIVRRHGGVLQTHEMPGMGGHAYVLEVPISAAAAEQARQGDSAAAAGRTSGTGEVRNTSGRGTSGGGAGTGRTPTAAAAAAAQAGRRARRGPAGGPGNGTNGAGTNGAGTNGAGTNGAGTNGAATNGAGTNGGGANGGAAPRTPGAQGADPRAPHAGSAPPASAPGNDDTADEPRPTGRRRARRHPDEEQPAPAAANADTDGQGSGAHRHARGGAPQAGPPPAAMGPVPPQGMAGQPSAPGGRRARRGAPAEAGQGRSALALPPAAADRTPESALPPELGPVGLVPAQHGARNPRGGAAQGGPAGPGAQAAQGGVPVPSRSGGGGLAVRGGPVPPNAAPQGGGWPAAPGPATPPAPQGGRAMPALPAARTPEQQQNNWNQPQNDPNAGPGGPYGADEGPYAPDDEQYDTGGAPQPTGRRRARRPLADEQPEPGAMPGAQAVPAMPAMEEGAGQPGSWPGGPAEHRPQPQRRPQQLPAAEPAPGPDTTQGRAISVRTLGQGVPFAQQVSEHHPHNSQAQLQTPSGGTAAAGGLGRRRKLAAKPDPAGQAASAELEPVGHPGAPGAQPRPQPGSGPGAGPGSGPGSGAHPQRPGSPQSSGRAFAIGAPDEGAEGPEPLDGPNGAIEVVDDRTPPPDDELPPEPLDNPRRLLVWPAPDMSTQQALSDRGYRPVIVHSREEVDAQIAAYPAALFVDPLTGPITRTALQSLRTAAVAAEVPVLVTAGLGQASREAAYGADPAVLFKALAPRDSEQHPPRVLLIEEHQPISDALTATLERRGMQVARAATDADAVALAAQMRPNLVVMDLMQVRRRRAGIVDWLRGNGLLNRTPLVVYTSADMDPANLSRLSSGETVLFLAERSTSAEVQGRIVDLLAKIGNN